MSAATMDAATHAMVPATTHGPLVALLGGFRVLVDGRRVQMGRPSERLVAFLALAGGPVSRLRAASVLWPDCPEQRALANLRSAVWKLGPLADALLETDRRGVALLPGVAVDVRGPAAAAADATLLPDWYDDWVVSERERFQQRARHALEELSTELSLAGRHADAVDAALRAVAIDPLCESARRALIDAHLAEGNVAVAIGELQRFERLLDEELGITQAPQLRLLLGRALPNVRPFPMGAPSGDGHPAAPTIGAPTIGAQVIGAPVIRAHGNAECTDERHAAGRAASLAQHPAFGGRLRSVQL